jgi:hypothetical protein
MFCDKDVISELEDEPLEFGRAFRKIQLGFSQNIYSPTGRK